MTVFLVYTLIRAEPGFDIDITNAHNPSDQETVFIRKLPGLGIMIFFLTCLLIEFGQIKQKVENGSCSRLSCVNQHDFK